MYDYYQEQMTKIATSVLAEKLKAGVTNPASLAAFVAQALRDQGYVQWTGIGGISERRP